jgi:hypothetical protein
MTQTVKYARLRLRRYGPNVCLTYTGKRAPARYTVRAGACA